ncbi:unnamed protein product [Ectocarpus sp. 6 AP-2014]
MTRNLLAPCESLRLCFRSDLPAHWTLGEPVAVTVALESEAGVRAQHPHSNHVWAEPQPSSSSARDGLATGAVPLRVTLEGERANRFLLDVSSSIEEGNGVGGGGADRHDDSSHADQGRRCAPFKGLTLDLSTGTAHGWVTVLPSSRPTEPRTPPDLDHDDSTSVCTCPAVAAQRRRRRRRRQAREAAAGEENGCEPEGEEGVVAGAEVQLSISLSPAWARRFNRPVLPLESLPALVHSPPHHVAAVGTTPTVATPTPPTGRLQGEGQKRAVIGRSGACNVRRLRFEVGVARGGGDRDTGRRTIREEEKREENSGSKFTANEAEGATVEDSHLAEAPARKHKGDCCGGPRNISLPPPPSPPTTTPASSWPSLSSSPVGNAAAISGSDGDGATSGLSSCSASSGSGSTACDDDDDDDDADDDDERGNGIIEVCAAESASLGGFFGTVWDCSLKMGAFLAALGPASLEGKRVVELGAATGTLSALCAALGASEVVATDTKDLLPLLTFNLARNSCPGSLNVEACEYDWGSPVGHHPALSRGGGFDFVICSDLLYDPAGWEPLLESLRQLLAAAGGRQRQPARGRGAAGAGSSPTAPSAPAVVYLAHRTRNPQESEFFDALLGQEGGRGPAAEASRRGDPPEGGEEGVLSFRCRRLPEEGVGGCHDEGCRGGEGLVWRGGCFPDVALYELSPVFAR